MKKNIKLIALAGAVAAIGIYAMTGKAEGEDTPQTPPAGYSVTLNGQDGAAVGKAEITAGAKGILLSVAIDKMTPGWHAIHFHGVGDCADHADHFKKSGGHALEDGQEHGYFSEAGPHSGDLPNFYVHADGTAKFQYYSTDMTLARLMDEDGSALVIHAHPDDYVSAPAGNAGDRLACGLVTQIK